MTFGELRDILCRSGMDETDITRTLVEIAERGACTDCGTAAAWRHAGEYPHYCRRCYEKNGYRATRVVDPDKLDALVGPDMADKILAVCE